MLTTCMSDKFPMYPILEDPPPYPHQVYPAPTHPPHMGHAHSSAPQLNVRIAKGDVMTDNPNYEEVRKVAPSVTRYIPKNTKITIGLVQYNLPSFHLRT